SWADKDCARFILVGHHPRPLADDPGCRWIWMVIRAPWYRISDLQCIRGLRCRPCADRFRSRAPLLKMLDRVSIIKSRVLGKSEPDLFRSLKTPTASLTFLHSALKLRFCLYRERCD